DPSTGSVAVLASGPTRSIARLLRADASSGSAWATGATTAITETRSAAGLSAPISSSLRFSTDAPLLYLQSAGAPAPAAALRITGIPGDPAWRTSYGLALGAILAWDTKNPALTPLLSLRRT